MSTIELQLDKAPAIPLEWFTRTNVNHESAPASTNLLELSCGDFLNSFDQKIAHHKQLFQEQYGSLCQYAFSQLMNLGDTSAGSLYLVATELAGYLRLPKTRHDPTTLGRVIDQLVHFLAEPVDSFSA